MNLTISAAVGSGSSPNKPTDVFTVKALLTVAAINQGQKAWDPGAVNTSYDAATASAIAAFQTAKLGKATGVVEPGQRTLQLLADIARAASLSIKPTQAPVLISKSRRDPGKNLDGTVANDMKYGDYTKEQIKNIRWNFAVDDALEDLDKVTADTLFASFRLMATTLFSTGQMQSNILRMIQQFQDNTGGTYSDPSLVRVASTHARTLEFLREFEPKLALAVAKYNGDITKIKPGIDIIVGTHIHFNTAGDILGGMTIATNDIWAWTIEITKYEFDGLAYGGEYTLTLYDHFGLDEPDVDNSKQYGNLAGFRAWFILQHLQRFAYKPFMTVIEIKAPFRGSLR